MPSERDARGSVLHALASVTFVVAATQPAVGQPPAAGPPPPPPPELEAASSSPEAARLLSNAQARYQAGDYDVALRDAEAALALIPEDLGALRLVGRLRLLQRDFAGATQALRKAIGLSPHDPDLRAWLATASRAQRREPASVPGSASSERERAQPDADAFASSGEGRGYEVPILNASGAATGALLGVLLGAVTADSAGGDTGALTALLVTGAGTLAGGSLGAGLAAPSAADWSPWLTIGSGALITGIGLVAGDRALTQARSGDPDARGTAVHADLLIASGLLVAAGATVLSVVRSHVSLGDAADLRVSPAVGRGHAGLVAAGRF